MLVYQKLTAVNFSIVLNIIMVFRHYMKDETHVLEIKNFSVYLNENQALNEDSDSILDRNIVNNVSLSIETGELDVIMGPNGSGKTTLIYGLLKHPYYDVSGKVLLDGENITDLDTSEISKRGITTIFQNPPDLEGIKLRTLLWNISKDYFENFKEYNDRLKELLLLLRFDETVLNRNLVGFSGGEKKRIELLQVLLMDPKFIIIDELDSGVDVDNLKLIKKILLKIKRNKGILLITHSTKFLSDLDVDVLHIYLKGRIIKSGGKELAAEIEAKGYDSIV